MNGPKLQVRYVNPSGLKPCEYNPRHWDARAIASLTESIKRFGLVDPLLVNSAPGREGIVIGGHFRLKIANDLGFTEVPVVYVDIDNIEKEKELNLRLNRNLGDWDFELLKSFDIDLLLDAGFNEADLGAVWDSALETEDDELDMEKAVEEAKDTNIKPGDLFALGNHRLLCGNSTDVNTVLRVAGAEHAVMIYTDPPYNINLNYDGGISGNKSYGGTTNDAKTDAEYRYFLKQTMQNALAVMPSDSHWFYFCDQRYIGMIQSLYEELGIKNQRVALWVKNGANPVPGVAFNKAYEPCVYGTVGKPYLAAVNNLTEIMNKEIGTGNRTIDDILDLIDVWLVKRLPGQEYAHPTEKPPTLHEKALRRCTKPGDIVLDLFGGSGSTLIACEQMKRRCFMVEIEPVFIQLIINRYEKLTGDKAEKIS